jgi:hypothetical protein
MIGAGSHETVAIRAEDEDAMTARRTLRSVSSARLGVVRGFAVAIVAGLWLLGIGIETGQAAGKNTEGAKSAQFGTVLLRHVQRCFVPPVGAAEADLSVEVRFTLAQDGSLDGEPILLTAPAHPLGPALAKAAIQAVKTCAPYPAPPKEHASWKSIDATFKAREQQ